jgi:hypothetical protein
LGSKLLAGKNSKRFYPEKYELFHERISGMLMEAFPGVMGTRVYSQPTLRAQEFQQRRENKERDEMKQILIEMG